MESVGFRSKFGGFNKDDVLNYIHSLQEEHAADMAALQERAEAERAAYEKALNDANAELVRQFEQLKAEREEQENLQQLISDEYAANRTLRGQLATASEQPAPDDALREQVVILSRQILELQSENNRLAAENDRYRELVDQVGSFVVEVRAMGKRYLDDANDRCQSRLSTISRMIASLSAELRAASDELVAADATLQEQNGGAAEQLNALAREMERSAAKVTDTKASTADIARFF